MDHWEISKIKPKEKGKVRDVCNRCVPSKRLNVEAHHSLAVFPTKGSTYPLDHGLSDRGST